MQVLALKSFVSVIDGQVLMARAGQMLEMPEGADWVQAGLVTLAQEVETATLTLNAETADVRPRKRERR